MVARQVKENAHLASAAGSSTASERQDAMQQPQARPWGWRGTSGHVPSVNHPQSMAVNASMYRPPSGVPDASERIAWLHISSRTASPNLLWRKKPSSIPHPWHTPSAANCFLCLDAYHVCRHASMHDCIDRKWHRGERSLARKPALCCHAGVPCAHSRLDTWTPK